MSHPLENAYWTGQVAACESFGVKEAGVLGQIGKWGGKALQWGGRAAGVVPVAGEAVGAIAGGLGGVMQGAAQGEGWKGMAARGAAGAATGAMPLGAGLVAGAASDLALDKMLAKKPPGPQNAPMPGMMGQGHLPGHAA